MVPSNSPMIPAFVPGNDSSLSKRMLIFLRKLLSRTEPEPVRDNNFLKKSGWCKESKNEEEHHTAEQKHHKERRPRLFLTWCLPRVRPERWRAENNNRRKNNVPEGQNYDQPEQRLQFKHRQHEQRRQHQQQRTQHHPKIRTTITATATSMITAKTAAKTPAPVMMASQNQ